MPHLDQYSIPVGTWPIPISAAQLILTTRLPTAVRDRPYIHTVKAEGSNASYQWTVTPELLQPGLSLDTLNGTIQGMPSETGTFSFGISVTDSLGHVSVQNLSITSGDRRIATHDKFGIH